MEQPHTFKMFFKGWNDGLRKGGHPVLGTGTAFMDRSPLTRIRLQDIKILNIVNR
jgi:hypothetical protein